MDAKCAMASLENQMVLCGEIFRVLLANKLKTNWTYKGRANSNWVGE